MRPEIQAQRNRLLPTLTASSLLTSLLDSSGHARRLVVVEDSLLSGPSATAPMIRRSPSSKRMALAQATFQRVVRTSLDQNKGITESIEAAADAHT